LVLQKSLAKGEKEDGVVESNLGRVGAVFIPLQVEDLRDSAE
jgi:hypothetical protein